VLVGGEGSDLRVGGDVLVGGIGAASASESAGAASLDTAQTAAADSFFAGSADTTTDPSATDLAFLFGA
jgi:hypothetical protein